MTKLSNQTNRIIIVTVVKDDLVGLRKTYQSILKQTTHPDWLLVLPAQAIDFKKQVENLIAAYKNFHIIFDDATGIYPAMNIASQNINPQDWVWFLNSGDELYDVLTIESVKVHLEQKIPVMYGGFELQNELGRTLDVLPPPASFKAEKQLFARQFISHQAILIKNYCIQSCGGFNTKYKIAADWDLISRVMAIYPSMRLDLILCKFKMGGMSSTFRQRGNRELFLIRNKILGRRWLVQSLSFYIFRMVRNQIVLVLENYYPEELDDVRVFRARIRQRRLKHSKNECRVSKIRTRP